MAQLMFSYSPTGGQGTAFFVDVSTKEEAAWRITQAMQGKLFLPKSWSGYPDPTLYIGRPVFVKLDGPPDWLPWLKQQFDWFDAHY